VVETRESPHGTRRRRECRKCGHRFTTFEVPVLGIIAAGSQRDANVPDAGEIAYEVGEQIEDVIDRRLDGLPDEVIDRLQAFVEEERAALDSPRLELVEGDYEEDAG
jgi:transcriptional regulator NrdR family protein